MSDPDLFTAVAKKTGEDLHEIRRHGFVLTGPDETGTGPQPLPGGAAWAHPAGFRWCWPLADLLCPPGVVQSGGGKRYPTPPEGMR